MIARWLLWRGGQPLGADGEMQSHHNNPKFKYLHLVGKTKENGASPTLAYDANGNIKHLQQWGLKLGGSIQIDDMVYTYYSNTNKLRAVTEQGSGAMDHKLGRTDTNRR